MTTEQAAAALKCSLRSVQRHAAQGRLAGAIKIGRDWHVPAATVEALTHDDKKEERCQQTP